MIKYSNTDVRVADILKRMQKAMPEIKRQIEVYNKRIKSGSRLKSPTAISRNV